jgi:hypothetical protein
MSCAARTSGPRPAGASCARASGYLEAAPKLDALSGADVARHAAHPLSPRTCSIWTRSPWIGHLARHRPTPWGATPEFPPLPLGARRSLTRTKETTVNRESPSARPKPAPDRHRRAVVVGLAGTPWPAGGCGARRQLEAPRSTRLGQACRPGARHSGATARWCRVRCLASAIAPARVRNASWCTGAGTDAADTSCSSANPSWS